MTKITWTKPQTNAAFLLADGYTIEETASAVGVSTATISRWKAIITFQEEVDRLSHMVGLASRAARLRQIKKMLRKIGDRTQRDQLEWLKLMQSETDGVKLDLANLYAAFSEDETSMASSGPDGNSGEESQETDDTD